MRALGIDPGLVRTGWAIVEPVGSRPVVLAHGVITPPTSADLPARLADGARQLRQVLTSYQPDLVALEEVFTAPRHPRSALLMAHMRGAICLVLEEAGVPILALTATTVKQRLTSSGHASKEQVQRMVLRLTGREATERMRLDETDAIALALAGLHNRVVSGQWSVVSPHPEAARGKAALRRHISDLLQRSPDR
ncbi:MAG TPA: crossover junction endodeoxyribonuclease RuvC [Chloroflexota bacterium]|nr:crossover junction endodeoxyribonuclease RuvC [Chloroflexota bacterium]